MKRRRPFDWKPAAAALLALGLGALATAEEPATPTPAAMDASVREFVKAAGSGGQFDVEASRLAQALGTSPEVKAFADKMVADHRAAADELARIARDKGAVLPVALLERHQEMLEELGDESPGKEFDEAYRRHMVASHKEAVSLFDRAARGAADADVRAFAARTLPLLQHHAGMAERLPKS